MNKPICLVLTAILLVALSESLFSQSRPQIRFKIGANKGFIKLGHSKSYAYKAQAPMSLGVLALEYAQPIKKGPLSWFSGIALESQAMIISMNRENFQSVSSDPALRPNETTYRFYAGMARRLNLKNAKNPFYVFGGIGLAVNFNSHGGGIGYNTPSEGVTKNGEQFKSPYKTWIFSSGYQMWVYYGRDFRVTPTLFTGLRWQPINKKGKDGLGLEVLGNYGLSEYFSYQVPYTLDGVTHEERFPENGICAQLNLIIPLQNFGKKIAKRDQ